MFEAREIAAYKNKDGLSTLKYDVVEALDLPLYTKITVRIQGPQTVDHARLLFNQKLAQFKGNVDYLLLWGNTSGSAGCCCVVLEAVVLDI